jgi:hypothetical protein
VRRLAVIIPESIPSKASKGVHHLFSALSSLPDEFLIYYEPLKNPSHPDFIIIGPYLGLLVIEIRDWYPKHIQKVTKTRVYIENNGKRREDNPLFRAQHFLNQLSRKAKKIRFLQICSINPQSVTDSDFHPAFSLSFPTAPGISSSIIQRVTCMKLLVLTIFSSGRNFQG